MTQTKNIIISIILFCIIIIFNVYQKKRVKNIYKDTLYNKISNLKKILYIFSIITFIIVLILNIVIYGNITDTKTTISYIVNALSICILTSPITISNLYICYFKDEERISHIKTIVTNNINSNLLKKFKKADINIIYLSSKENDFKLKTIEEKDIQKSLLTKNIQIKTDNLNIIDNLINKENTIKEYKNTTELYNKIYNARGTHDNFIRGLKYTIRTYLAIIISYILLLIMGFPFTYNLLLAIILKIFTIITTNIIYKKMPYDKDIMERKVKDKNVVLGKQELLFTIIESFYISFVITLPYMYIMSQGGTQEFANTTYYLIFIYSELFIIYSNISESFILINIFKSFKNIYLILYSIFNILIILLLNFTTIFNTRNIYLHNNISCILFSLIPIVFIEITKLARYFTLKGKKKNENKNNKKQRRSKSNNS